jgi:hypothetical protein
MSWLFSVRVFWRDKLGMEKKKHTKEISYQELIVQIVIC